MIIVAVLILVAAGAAVLTVSWLGPLGGGGPYAARTMGETAVASKGPAPLGPVYQAGVFTVNLAGSGRGSSFLRATIALEVEDRKSVEALQAREPAVRDAIIVTLRSFTSAELAAPEGLVELRERLLQALTPLLPEGEVRHVYFQELITQ